jgi:hypothetical protein
MISWILKLNIKYRNKLRKKKGKISQFGIRFGEKYKLDNLRGKVVLEIYQYTEIRRKK